jgi:hypothetical protein
MATKTASCVHKEALTKWSTPNPWQLDRITKRGIVSYVVNIVQGGNYIRVGLFAHAITIALGGDEQQAIEAELKASARRQRFLDRIAGEKARRGGNLYVVRKGKKGHRLCINATGLYRGMSSGDIIYRNGQRKIVRCKGIIYTND